MDDNNEVAIRREDIADEIEFPPVRQILCMLLNRLISLLKKTGMKS